MSRVIIRVVKKRGKLGVFKKNISLHKPKKRISLSFKSFLTSSVCDFSNATKKKKRTCIYYYIINTWLDKMFCKVLRYASQHDSAVWKFRESTTITPNTINMILFDWFVFFLLGLSYCPRVFYLYFPWSSIWEEIVNLKSF